MYKFHLQGLVWIYKNHLHPKRQFTRIYKKTNLRPFTFFKMIFTIVNTVRSPQPHVSFWRHAGPQNSDMSFSSQLLILNSDYKTKNNRDMWHFYSFLISHKFAYNLKNNTCIMPTIASYPLLTDFPTPKGGYLASVIKWNFRIRKQRGREWWKGG